VSVVYDAGVLVAADRGDRRVWAEHRARLELGVAPLTTGPVVAQVSRSGQQGQVRRFLRGCEIVPFAADEAHEVGALLGAAGMADVVDAHLIVVARASGATVLTSDEADLAQLAKHGSRPVRIRRI
jgi:predicted nucleic acid-binding protein